MKVSNNGRKFITDWEGCELTAYKDSGGVWTIGVGHTKGVRAGQKITKSQADAFLKRDLLDVEDAINELVTVKLHQDAFDAIASLVFNIGKTAFKKSTLLKKLNRGDFAGAKNEFLRWNHDNGRVVKGLTKRRQAEANLFWSGSPATKSGSIVKNPVAVGAVSTTVAAGADLATKANDQISTGTIIGIVAGILILLIGGYIIWTQYREHQQPDA